MPAAVDALFDVATFRLGARAAGLTDVTAQGRFVRFAPVQLAESAQLRLKRLYPGAVLKPAVRTVLVPFPSTARVAGTPLSGSALLAWARRFVDTVLTPGVPASAGTPGGTSGGKQ